MDRRKFSREYHVVCNGKTNRPSEKDLLTTNPQLHNSVLGVTKIDLFITTVGIVDCEITLIIGNWYVKE